MPTLSKVLRELAQTCAPDLSARDAVRQLQTSGADLLLVEQNGTVLGVFGHREAVAVYADGSAPVRQYMPHPVPVRNASDSSAAHAERMVPADTLVVIIT